MIEKLDLRLSAEKSFIFFLHDTKHILMILSVFLLLVRTIFDFFTSFATSMFHGFTIQIYQSNIETYIFRVSKVNILIDSKFF